jgi:hypothetical protein
MEIRRFQKMAQFPAMKKGTRLAVGVVAILVLGCGVAQSSAPAPSRTVFGQGHTAGYSWRSITESDGRPHGGICLEVVVFKGSLKRGGDINSRCSKPADKRGAIVGAVQPSYRGGKPRITAIAAAFSPVVKRVATTDFDGSQKEIQLRRVRLRARPEFSYAAFAVRGAWCASELRTYDRSGEVLWTASSSELAEAVGAKNYRPANVCPQ